MNTAAIILAAGQSRRMGRAKALLPFRDGNFLSVIAENLGRRCSPVVGVFGFEAARVSQAAPPQVTPVENPNHAQGMLTSLQAGLRAIPASCEQVLFTLVDHPAVSPATVDLILGSPARIAIPRFQSRRGHPVLIHCEIIAEFLEEPATSKVRDVIDRHAHQIAYVEVEDPGISDDVDDPARYEKLLARDTLQLR